MAALLPKRPVLIIEPSPTLRSILEMHVVSKGYPCMSYAHPLPALTELRQHLAGPVLVLLSESQMSPGPSGWEVLCMLLQWKVSLPVIFLLEDAQTLAVVKARVAGACVTLSKPFRIQEVLEALERCGQM